MNPQTAKLQKFKTIEASRWPASPRSRRVIVALLRGPLMREEVDRISGASNGPEVIFYLRRGMGLEIPCKRVHGTDLDGRPCAPGCYRLTRQDRARVLRTQRAAQAAPKLRQATIPLPSPRKRASGLRIKRKGRR